MEIVPGRMGIFYTGTFFAALNQQVSGNEKDSLLRRDKKELKKGLNNSGYHGL
jgi:hypothetical protein